MERAYNFSAGPAALPEEVLKKAQAELLNWNAVGASVMEVSHRGKAFVQLTENIDAKLRQLLNIPNDYHILFLQGGASLQFSAIPLNLLADGETAVYLVNGSWSDKAAIEAKRLKSAHVIDILTKKQQLVTISPQSEWSLPTDYKYLHYTPNETISGVALHKTPKPTQQGSTQQGYIIADMSSCILSEPIDINQFDLIYAGAQKNIGPAGLTLVIIKDRLLHTLNQQGVPDTMRYDRMVKHNSMLNTPPTFSWYLAGLVFDWIAEQGGLQTMANKNQQKSDLLYQYIDNSDFYSNPVDKPYRSKMNIPFLLKDESLNPQFLQQAEAAKLINLKGHRSVGGMRASIYNAMPIEGVQKLIQFMQDFAKNH